MSAQAPRTSVSARSCASCLGTGGRPALVSWAGPARQGRGAGRGAHLRFRLVQAVLLGGGNVEAPRGPQAALAAQQLTVGRRLQPRDDIYAPSPHLARHATRSRRGTVQRLRAVLEEVGVDDAQAHEPRPVGARAVARHPDEAKAGRREHVARLRAVGFALRLSTACQCLVNAAPPEASTLARSDSESSSIGVDIASSTFALTATLSREPQFFLHSSRTTARGQTG